MLSPKTVKDNPTSFLTHNVIEEHKGIIFEQEEEDKGEHVTP